MKKYAFTLSEVLITLGIIGVVAALTMPSLITKYEKQVTVTRLKKFYSIHMQTLKMTEAIEEGAAPERNDASVDNPDFALAMLEYRYKHYVKTLNIEKMTKGAVMAFPDGSGVYFSKRRFEADAPEAYESYAFCIDYKKCKTLDTIDFDSMFNTRNIFCADPDRLCRTGYSDRETLKNFYCTKKTNHLRDGCAQLIMTDGWEIKDDYPW